ncbi:MAG: hypothetical protein JHC33_02640 [Ignisphaera sp.]|nr:hypothetical protein [Ignisphaera sp.]
MLRILYLPTAQEIPLEPLMGRNYAEVSAFIRSAYTRFYNSTAYHGVSWTTCAPHMGTLGGEIPKYLIQLVELPDVQDSLFTHI